MIDLRKHNRRGRPAIAAEDKQVDIRCLVPRKTLMALDPDEKVAKRKAALMAKAFFKTLNMSNVH